MPTQRFFVPKKLRRNCSLAMRLLEVLEQLHARLTKLEHSPIPPEPLEVTDLLATPPKQPWWRKLLPPMKDPEPTRTINAWQICSINSGGLFGTLYLDAQTGTVYTDGGVPVPVPLDYAKMLLLPTDDLLEVLAEVQKQCETMEAFVSVLAPA